MRHEESILREGKSMEELGVNYGAYIGVLRTDVIDHSPSSVWLYEWVYG